MFGSFIATSVFLKKRYTLLMIYLLKFEIGLASIFGGNTALAFTLMKTNLKKKRSWAYIFYTF